MVGNKRKTLEDIARERGENLQALILRLLNELGSQRAVARTLGVADSTISVWVRKNQIVPIVIWKRKEEIA